MKFKACIKFWTYKLHSSAKKEQSNSDVLVLRFHAPLMFHGQQQYFFNNWTISWLARTNDTVWQYSFWSDQDLYPCQLDKSWLIEYCPKEMREVSRNFSILLVTHYWMEYIVHKTHCWANCTSVELLAVCLTVSSYYQLSRFIIIIIKKRIVEGVKKIVEGVKKSKSFFLAHCVSCYQSSARQSFLHFSNYS